jgi:regulator of protease activity HflC (stomatin/prohibitin superfamily)
MVNQDQDIATLGVKNDTPGLAVGAVVTFLGLALIAAGAFGGFGSQSFALPLNVSAAILIVSGLVISRTLRVAGQYETAVVLRFGKLRSTHTGQLFWIIPTVDVVIDYVDNRVQSSRFNAERVLTKDTVPVDADAILFWVVTNAEQATLEVANYRRMILQAAQASLRDMIGKSTLSTVLSDSVTLAEHLQAKIAEITHEWGIDLKSVEIRDVQIPADLQTAMSREAQAEREKSARVILSEAEQMIAENFSNAAKTYENTKGAIELRAMNLLYESMKTGSNTIVIPTHAANSIGLENPVAIAQAIAGIGTQSAPGQAA